MRDEKIFTSKIAKHKFNKSTLKYMPIELIDAQGLRQGVYIIPFYICLLTAHVISLIWRLCASVPLHSHFVNNICKLNKKYLKNTK